jgi:hypothetical protein
LATKQVITDGINWCNCDRHNHDSFNSTIGAVETPGAHGQLQDPQEVTQNNAMKEECRPDIANQRMKARCVYGDITASYAQVPSVKRAMGSHQGFV